MSNNKYLSKIQKYVLLSTIVFISLILISYGLSFTQTDAVDNGNVDESAIEENISKSISPEELIYTAGNTHQIIIFGEIHKMAQSKTLLKKTIKRLHFDYGFDYLMLEIGEDYQHIVDEYLETGNELLLRKNPWTLFSPFLASEQYLKIYKSVYQINKISTRKMKIICADYDPLKYSQDYEMIRNRDKHFMEVLNKKVFLSRPYAKMVIFIGAYHAMKHNVWEEMKEFDPNGMIFKSDPLGMHLERAFPNKVFSIYIDGIIPPGYDSEGFFLTQIGSLYKTQQINMPVIPFALMIKNIDKIKLKVMKNISLTENYDGYIFVGELEPLKLIDIKKWNNKRNKD